MKAADAGARLPQPWQGTPLRGGPRGLVLTLVTVEVAAAVLFVLAILTSGDATFSWPRAIMLFVLSVVFEELSLQVGKMRLLVGTGPQPDMTSVWTFAGALVLSPGFAVMLAVAVATHIWLRRQRAAGQLLYRKIYSAATIVLACLAAEAVSGGPEQTVGGPAWALKGTLLLIAALVAYTCVNRVLISVAVVLAGGPRNKGFLLGSWDDNTLELATLCLGYLVAQVLVDAPWLTCVVLVPMVLLQRGALVKQLEETASTDTKTQLLTPLAWRQLAQRELARASQGSGTAAVLVIDLDEFKVVNDVHGHLAGDAALFAAGSRVTQELRQADIVGRFGGEEFVVLLPDLDADAAMVIAERLRTRIRSIRLAELNAEHVDGGECEHTLSASIGVAVCPQHASELSGLLQAADGALYVAKRAGRNRVVLAQPRDHGPTAFSMIG